jgi:hypothetical protein
MVSPMKVGLPIVVDLGRARDAHIGELRQGGGRLAEDVAEVMRLIRLNADPASRKKIFVPVVAIYTRARDGRPEPDDDE